MSPERFQYLIDHYLAGDASEGEKGELARYLQQPSADKDELLRQALESVWMRYEPDVSMPDEMSSRILRSLAPEASGRLRRSIMSRSRWVAAAAILFAAVSLYVLTRPSTPQTVRPIADIPAQKDIGPGGNKAFLTLGDGHRVALDSASDGILAEQGNATITKLAGGRLAYIATKGADTSGSVIPGAALFNTVSTPAGGQYRLTLSDGTSVWLNSTSSITYPATFSGKERLVRITGEAYFEVARNKSMPFRVETGSSSVQVLGTAFDINAYPDETSINTTLTEGAVKVSSPGKEQLLQPGQQARVSKDGAITWIRQADIEQVLAWKNGLFSFRDADIRTVMRQLSRWYNVEVSFAGTPPAGTFSGEIGRGLTLTQVLNGLSQEKVRYRIEAGNRIIIQP